MTKKHDEQEMTKTEAVRHERAYAVEKARPGFTLESDRQDVLGGSSAPVDAGLPDGNPGVVQQQSIDRSAVRDMQAQVDDLTAQLAVAQARLDERKLSLPPEPAPPEPDEPVHHRV